MAKPEIYVSSDGEATGPIPGPYSLLSFASAAYTEDKKLIGTFSRNLVELEGSSMHPDQAKFWNENPEQWAECRKVPVDVIVAMKDYHAWLTALPGKPIFVGFPAAYDFMFIHWYLHMFAGSSPFGHAALDTKTFLMALMNKGYKDVSLTKLPRKWFDNLPHTHVALDDAIEQGALFINALTWSRKLGINKQFLALANAA